MAKKKCRLDRKTDLTFLGVQKKKKKPSSEWLTKSEKFEEVSIPHQNKSCS